MHAIILAGGRSSRMGSDKKLLRINGETLISRLYRLLAPHFDGIIISTSAQEQNPVPGALHVKDEQPGKGPLMAIFSSLRQSPSRVNFVVACDIPEVNMTRVRHMLSDAALHDIVVPSFAPGLFEPLFAVYTRDVIPVMERQLAAGCLRPSECFLLCRTRILSMADSGWYRNLNTPQDFIAYTSRSKVRIA